MGIKVGVDLMGSNSSPQEIFQAVLAINQEIAPGDSLVVFAQHALLPELRTLYHGSDKAIEFVTTDESIEMEDSPLFAVRRKKNSSMAAGMRLLKEKAIDAFVSTGNTGALVASAMLHLALLPQVERPALLVMMPTVRGKVAVLDVGAHVMAKPGDLIGYARLGSLYRQCLFSEKAPTIGLLNIGVEEQKGTKELQDSYQALREMFQERFLGNIEGREVFQGKVDVLVTDGFTGNVFLKTSEGISSFLADYLQKQFDIPQVIHHLHRQFNYAEHPGAFLCGLDGIVVKCHGFSDRTALMNGIRGAFDLVRSKIIDALKEKGRNP